MPRSIWQVQWHLEKHSLSSSRCQSSSRQRQKLLWLASQTSIWSQEWHPKSSTPRPSPQQNHQSTSQGTKAQLYETEKLASPSSYLDSPTCPTYCTNRWSQPNHHSMMLPRWPITRMWYPTKQGRVVRITNQLIVKQPW